MRRLGFTVMELLVALGIFAVISSIVMVNFNAGNRSSELRLGADLLASFIRDAEGRTASGSTACACVTGGDVSTAQACSTGPVACPSGVETPVLPLGGWGLHAEQGGKTVTVFADYNNDHRMNAGEAVRSEQLSPSGGVVVRTLACGNPWDLSFVPPFGTVWSNGSTANAGCAVTLEQTLSGARRAVEYFPVSGRIDITAL